MPGVPPDAINNLKRVFKGMFKRGKKNKTDSQPTSSYGTATATPSATTAQPAPPGFSAQTTAPQLPPIQNSSGSPFGSATNSAIETSKPLPPTHPLATGTQEKPSVAVPSNQDAQPGPRTPVDSTPAAASAPAAAPAVTSTTDGTDKVREDQLAPGRMSPAEQGSNPDGTRSGAVSAIDETSQPEEPVKTDSGIEQPKTEEQVEQAKDITTRAPSAGPAKENAAPAIDTSAPTTESQPQSAINGVAPTSATEGRPSIDPAAEEKVAVTMEEPPPIRAVRTAPGMSATSGPLEEFPEGGYAEHH